LFTAEYELGLQNKLHFVLERLSFYFFITVTYFDFTERYLNHNHRTTSCFSLILLSIRLTTSTKYLMLLTSFRKASISLLSQTVSSIHLRKLLQLSLRDIIIIIIINLYRMESRWERAFPHRSIPALGVYPASCTTGTASLSPAVRQLGRVVDHPPLSNVQVKERVELYFYSSTGPS